jgi:hypothetical protein
MRESLVALPAAGAGSPEKLTDGYGNDLYPSVDYQHGRMAFSSARSGHRNLWIANADGSDPTPLTTESSIDDRPTFSPDGQQLAFVSDRGGEQGIWIINAAGGAPRLLAHVIVLDTLSWSHDRKRLGCRREGRGVRDADAWGRLPRVVPGRRDARISRAAHGAGRSAIDGNRRSYVPAIPGRERQAVVPAASPRSQFFERLSGMGAGWQARGGCIGSRKWPRADLGGGTDEPSALQETRRAADGVSASGFDVV